MLYNKLNPTAKDQLHKQLLKSITTIEEEVDRRKQSEIIEKVYDDIMEEHNMNDHKFDEEMISFSTAEGKISPNSSNPLGISARSETSRYSKVSRFSMGFIKNKAPT